MLLPAHAGPRDEYWPSDWSSEGIVYVSGGDRQGDDIWMLPLAGDRKPYPLVREPGQQNGPKVSPDGKWIAYQTEFAGGPPEIVIRSLATGGGKWRVSVGGGASPRWRRDGKELFYLGADGTLMAVPIEPSSGALRLGAAKPLFQTSHSVLAGGQRPFDVSPDGQRFLVLTSESQARTSSIVIVSNWQALLNKSRL